MKVEKIANIEVIYNLLKEKLSDSEFYIRKDRTHQKELIISRLDTKSHEAEIYENSRDGFYKINTLNYSTELERVLKIKPSYHDKFDMKYVFKVTYEELMTGVTGVFTNKPIENHWQNKWIRTANMAKYDVVSAFNDLNEIDWTKSKFDIKKGDLVYIYVGKPFSRIMYKTVCIKDDISADEVNNNDLQYWKIEYEQDLLKTYVRLQLIEKYDDDRLSLNAMQERKIIKGSIQGAYKSDNYPELFQYIEETIGGRDDILNANSEQDNVISFPASNTYELIQKTLIHAHPIKKGFPNKVTPYITIRRTGGYMDNIYRVCRTIEIIPDEKSLEKLELTVQERDRLKEYYSIRKESFDFKTKDTLYRFYFLEIYIQIEPAFQMKPNLQSYKYYSLSDFGCDNLDDKIIDDVDEKELSDTEKELIIKSRIGQGIYRDKLVEKYNGRCAICGMKRTELLIASHIKEWKNSDANERLDVNNGLLLCALHDSVFDKHFITFDSDGKMLISDDLDQNDRSLLNINSNMKIDMNEKMKKYMSFHNEIWGQKEIPKMMVDNLK